jgi:hypothetical protein
MKTLKGIFGLIAVCALVLTVLPAANAVSVSDNLTVLFSNGAFRAGTTAPEGAGTEGPLMVFLVDTDLANAAMAGRPTLFTEGPNGPVSDILGILPDPNNPVHLVIGFVSDDGGLVGDSLIAALALFADVNGAVNIFQTLPETGNPQDVTAYVNPQAANGPYTASFFSDVDVPDGGSAVALLGIALAGIEGARRVLRARKA